METEGCPEPIIHLGSMEDISLYATVKTEKLTSCTRYSVSLYNHGCFIKSLVRLCRFPGKFMALSLRPEETWCHVMSNLRYLREYVVKKRHRNWIILDLEKSEILYFRRYDGQPLPVWPTVSVVSCADNRIEFDGETLEGFDDDDGDETLGLEVPDGA